MNPYTSLDFLRLRLAGPSYIAFRLIGLGVVHHLCILRPNGEANFSASSARTR
jgi:hypothetical protein